MVSPLGRTAEGGCITLTLSCGAESRGCVVPDGPRIPWFILPALRPPCFISGSSTGTFVDVLCRTPTRLGRRLPATGRSGRLCPWHRPCLSPHSEGSLQG